MRAATCQVWAMNGISVSSCFEGAEITFVYHPCMMKGAFKCHMPHADDDSHQNCLPSPSYRVSDLVQGSLKALQFKSPALKARLCFISGPMLLVKHIHLFRPFIWHVIAANISSCSTKARSLLDQDLELELMMHISMHERSFRS